MLKWLTPRRGKSPAAAQPAPSASSDELMRQAFPLHEAGNLQAAERLYRQILEQSPDYADAHYLLGRMSLDAGRLDAALRHVRDAVRANAHEPAFHKTLGEIHYSLGHWLEAVVHLGKAVALKRTDLESWNNLGCAHEKLDQVDEALHCFEHALELSPNSPSSLNNLAGALKDQGRIGEAIDLLAKARTLAPGDADILSNYLYALNLSDHFTAEQRFQAHLAFDAHFGAGVFGQPQRSTTDADPSRRLRIGYFSPDLRAHPVSCFIEAPLIHHDRRGYEIWCYYLHPSGDVVTGRLKRQADHWAECHRLNDHQIAERIAADGIDILVDLAGHTGGNRPAVLARKPAPVIATWLGYPNTTGLRVVDYRLSDARCDPPGLTEHRHTERLVRLPQQWCYSRPDVEAEVTALPATRRGYVRFGSFNNASKHSDEMLRVWAGILSRLPNARLLVWGVGTEHRARIRSIFEAAGIVAHRLDFSHRTSFAEQIAMYQDVDIALDTYPYSGVTTTFNSLWMGVPVVTLAGNVSAARSSHAILDGLGLADWSVATPAAYADSAIEHATDLSRLSQLRQQLRARLEKSAFMDGPRFTRQLEDAYRQMWRAYCAADGSLG